MVLGESITPLTVFGFLVVFAGFVVLKRRAIADLAGDTRRVVTQTDD